MRTSDQIDQLVADLSKAQATLKNPVKNKRNPHFNSTFADLASTLDAVRPVLAGYGLAIIQATDITSDGVILITRIAHKSGQWMESSYPVAKFGQHQAMAAGLTYAKRMALSAMVAVCGDDDLDGEDTKGVETDVKKKPTPVKPVADQPWDEETSSTTRDVMLETIDMANSEIELADWWKNNLPTINKLLAADRQVVIEAKDDRKQALKGKAA